ncbi:MAG: 50S ribosomal protein L6 [Candidatus Shapirobacteria bacterium]
MSRIGKQPITIPAGVTINIDGTKVTVTGPKGTLDLNFSPRIKVEVIENEVIVTRLGEDKKTKANHGTTRAHINNMVQGVQTHWKKELEIKGTGYKASLNGNKLRLNVGYIHPVDVEAPVGIQFELPEDTKIIITGANKEVVGQVASNIRKIRKPEPYKGKGIRYADEVIKLKAGKKAKA